MRMGKELGELLSASRRWHVTITRNHEAPNPHFLPLPRIIHPSVKTLLICRKLTATPASRSKDRLVFLREDE